MAQIQYQFGKDVIKPWIRSNVAMWAVATVTWRAVGVMSSICVADVTGGASSVSAGCVMHGDTTAERGVIDTWCMEPYEKSSVQITVL